MTESVAAFEDVKEEPFEQPDELPRDTPKPKYRSWRKKYRKMRLRFDDAMEEANTLFLTAHHLEEVAQRLQEQNDQLLEILMDINNSRKVPAQYRFDVSNSVRPEDVETLKSQYPKTESRGGHSVLDDLEPKVAYTAYDEALKEDRLPQELEDQDGHVPYGYITPKREEEYLAVIDNALDVIPLPSVSGLNTIIDPSVDLRPRHRSPPTERDFAIQHPVSVHNWLLHHKPQIKLEHDQYSERGEAGSTTNGAKKKGKREKTKEDAPFDALDEEIGFDASEEHFSKSKRKSKGDGDHTYRPKGGRSRAKRKRDKGDEGDGDAKEPKRVKGAGGMDADGDYADP